jgi:hypothetical protein
MKTISKKDINELVGGDMNSSGNDQPYVGSEVGTGPTQKPYNDYSDYEKGNPTNSDKVFARYRQNIPWYVGNGYTSVGTMNNYLNYESTIITKKSIEEKIEDLVNKTKINDIINKNYNQKVSKIIDMINNSELNKNELEQLKKAINDKEVTKLI